MDIGSSRNSSIQITPGASSQARLKSAGTGGGCAIGGGRVMGDRLIKKERGGAGEVGGVGGGVRRLPMQGVALALDEFRRAPVAQVVLDLEMRADAGLEERQHARTGVFT